MQLRFNGQTVEVTKTIKLWLTAASILGGIPAAVLGWEYLAGWAPWITKAQASEELKSVNKQWRRSADEIVSNLKSLGDTLETVQENAAKNTASIASIKFRMAEDAYDRTCEKAEEEKAKTQTVQNFRIRQLDSRYRSVLKYDPNFPKCTIHDIVR